MPYLGHVVLWVVVSDIRDIFKGFGMDTVELNYTVGGGAKQKKARELIIKNW